ncbi:hypothetical protein BBJ28_00026106 [Nothophytophthora sp. Chile5]|nr:hypothetical protein BBJ28_00026106 [Nothophytophthora sp. Chile5]
MLQCRQCRASIVKVEGCDTVICLCGFSMNWIEELSFKVDNRRHLIPVDMFDLKRFNEWRGWKAKTRRLVRNLSRFVRERELCVRKRELDKLMLAWPSAMAKLRLLVAASVSKIRFRKLVKRGLPRMRDMAQSSNAFESELFWAAYRRAHPEEVEEVEEAEADLFAMDLIGEL